MRFFSNRNLDHLTIEAGKHHETKDDPHQQIRRVTKILMHESYDPDLIDNDITLLKLDQPFVLNEFVNIVCLPDVVVVDGANCIVTGWGDTKSETCFSAILNHKIYKNIRRTTSITIVSFS